MSKPDNVIKLLLIEDSVDEAEQIISMLRNGGIALRPTRAANEAELEDLLERQPPDMILSANIGCITHLQSGTGTPVRHWVEVLDEALRQR